MKAAPKLPDESVNVSKTHPLNEAVTLIIGILLVMAVIFAVIAAFVDIAAPLVPLKTEAKVFGSLWDDLDAENFEDLGVVTESPELKAVVDRLAAHWSENPYDYRVGILEQDVPNALALPGGIILVTSELLEMAESENELAFVLGHELGHFHNRDHIKGLGRGILFSLLVASIGGGNAGDLVSTSSLLSESNFSRRDEKRADRFGLELVVKEYGHVSGSGDFFAKLSEGESNFDQAVANFAGSHPGSKNRVKELEDFAREQGWALDRELLPRLEF